MLELSPDVCSTPDEVWGKQRDMTKSWKERLGKGARKDRTIVRLQKRQETYYLAVPRWAMEKLGLTKGDRFLIEATSKSLFYDWVGVDR